jgi:hypothetical protein
LIPVLALLAVPVGNAVPAVTPAATPAATLPPPADTTPSTFARFVPERADDFAWENDLVAFRTYGPKLRGSGVTSGIDCWLKRVHTPIIDKWYAQEKRGMSYHQDHGEGHDPYHVGPSRGCGGLALWINDALVTSDTYLAWRIVERTRERSVFELDYAYPAQPGEAPIAETKRITIRLGEPMFRVESRFTRGGQPVADLPIAIGVSTQNGRGRAITNAGRRWIAVWDKIDGFGLGTGAILAPGFPAETREIKSAQKDTSHALLITRTNKAGVVAYAAGYGWEKAGAIRTPDQWTAVLDGLAFP